MKAQKTIIEALVLSVEPQNEVFIKGEFEAFLDKVQEWKDNIEGLVVTDDTQTDKMKMSKKARLELRKVRTSAKKKKEELKKESLAYGKAVQSVFNTIEAEIKPLEEALQANEDFVKNKIQAKIDARRDERMMIVEADGLNEYFTLEFLGTFDDDEFELLYKSAKNKKEASDAKEKAQQEALVEVARLTKEAEVRKVKIEKLEKENVVMKQNRVHITPDVPSFQIEDKLQPLFDAIRTHYQDASEKRKAGVVTLLNKILRWLE
tara:strand:- start:1122 stop:1910 length:789 start_codon:yes stop_codon:yes gene_type:complete